MQYGSFKNIGEWRTFTTLIRSPLKRVLDACGDEVKLPHLTRLLDTVSREISSDRAPTSMLLASDNIRLPLLRTLQDELTEFKKTRFYTTHYELHNDVEQITAILEYKEEKKPDDATRWTSSVATVRTGAAKTT